MTKKALDQVLQAIKNQLREKANAGQLLTGDMIVIEVTDKGYSLSHDKSNRAI